MLIREVNLYDIPGDFEDPSGRYEHTSVDVDFELTSGRADFDHAFGRERLVELIPKDIVVTYKVGGDSFKEYTFDDLKELPEKEAYWVDMAVRDWIDKHGAEVLLNEPPRK